MAIGPTWTPKSRVWVRRILGLVSLAIAAPWAIGLLATLYTLDDDITLTSAEKTELRRWAFMFGLLSVVHIAAGVALFLDGAWDRPRRMVRASVGAGCLAFAGGGIAFLVEFTGSSQASREPIFTSVAVAISACLAFALGWIAIFPQGWGLTAEESPSANRAA
jgi:hypothetical protein